MENVVHAVEEVKRALEFEARGFLVYDEGLLWLLGRMRADGELPSNCILKFSVHAGVANPLSTRLVRELGANTINPVPDLSLPMLAALRQAVDCPLDVFTDTAAEAGGLLRTYEVPEFVRIAAPVYLKCGPISQREQNHLPSRDELEERVRQTARVCETLERYSPELRPVSAEEATRAVPHAKALIPAGAG